MTAFAPTGVSHAPFNTSNNERSASAKICVSLSFIVFYISLKTKSLIMIEELTTFSS